MNRENIQQSIIDWLQEHLEGSSGDIYHGLNKEISPATIKRSLAILLAAQIIEQSGQSRSTKYKLNSGYGLLKPIDPVIYFNKEIDDRNIQSRFNFDLIRKWLPDINLFTAKENDQLALLHEQFLVKSKALSKTEYDREMERLAIDLSWKSSQIEGNTYSLLETERLFHEKQTATGKPQSDAIMLLNHKDAIEFMVKHKDYLHPLSTGTIEDLHSILVKDLGVDRNIRKRLVGVTGTNYKPLDNEFQIREALHEMCTLINNKKNPFEKALLALVLLSYIQAFADGNKRTARMVSNAILLVHDHCPLSFRTVDSIDYKKAMLIFYEQNNISAFKTIYLEQVRFAIETYF